MAYWLFKSEPNTFSIDDLRERKNQREPWDGVRNYQARNMLRDQVKVGDLAFFYHSSCEPPGIAGVMKIVKAGYPDETAWHPNSPYYDPKSLREKPRWFRVDVEFVRKFETYIPLELLKQQKALHKMIILKPGNRLSITPVTENEWKTILALEKKLSHEYQ